MPKLPSTTIRNVMLQKNGSLALYSSAGRTLSTAASVSLINATSPSLAVGGTVVKAAPPPPSLQAAPLPAAQVNTRWFDISEIESE